MMTLRLLIGAGLLCLALPVLAARQPPPMPLGDPLGVELVQEQQELGVDVPDTSAATAQFGLLGALIGTAIENSQVKNAELRVAELRDLLVDYPFQARMEAALRERLPSEGISPSPVIELRARPWLPADAAGTLAAPEERLVLVPRYAMRNDFELLAVGLSASFVVREPRANGKPRTRSLFSRRYAYQFPLDDVGLGADGDAGRWIAMGTPRLEAMLDRGIAHVADMLAYDLSAEGRVEAGEKVRRGSAQARGLQFNGRRLREGDGWVWVRSGNGTLQAVLGYEPVGDAPSVAEAALIAMRAHPPAAEPEPPPAGPSQAVVEDEAEVSLADAAEPLMPPAED